MKYDCYGFPRNDARYYRHDLKCAQTDTSGNYTYLRFSTKTSGKEAIHRIEKTQSGTLIRWAYGLWSERASLSYDNDLNHPYDVE